MSCLFCKCFHAVEPEEHRRAREAGACASHCGDSWSAVTAAFYVREHKRLLAGTCHLNPEPALVRCEGVCSKFEPGFNRNWITPPEADANLWDWSAEVMRDHIYGDYRKQESKRLAEENKTLKAALTASRRISASRLARIKGGKPEKAPAKPAPKRAALRLVAAE